MGIFSRLLKSLFGGPTRQNTISTGRDNSEVLSHNLDQSTAAVCPYCKLALDVMPTRKKKCQHCGKPIYFKRRPGDDSKKLMTEDEAKQVEFEWNRVNFEKDILETFTAFGFSSNELKRELSEMNNVNRGDFKWRLFQEALSRNAANRQALSSIYHQMAIHLVDEEKNPNQCLVLSHEQELYEFKELGFRKVKISTSPDSCSKCSDQKNKVFTIDDALKSEPLPCKKCESHYGFCRCTYSVIVSSREQ